MYFDVYLFIILFMLNISVHDLNLLKNYVFK